MRTRTHQYNKVTYNTILQIILEKDTVKQKNKGQQMSKNMAKLEKNHNNNCYYLGKDAAF